MNDSLYRWLKNRGYTGSLNDAIFQALGGTAGQTVNDKWITLGLSQGYGLELQGIMQQWAIVTGSSSTQTWNDAMGTLPP